MRIAICDDETFFTESLKTYIEDKYNSLDLLIELFGSGESLLQHYHGQASVFDIVFLDIEMKQIDGFQTAKAIQKIAPDTIIVFVTSHAELACEGYEVSAFRFITKPVDKRKLVRAIESAINQLGQTKTIHIRNETEEFKIKLADIVYIEAQDQQVAVYTETDHYLQRCSLSDYARNLRPEGFVLVHRSYLVNIRYIKGFNKQVVILENGKTIPLSRLRHKEFERSFHEYLNSTAY